ncbi:MAG: hypothetical protein FWE74_08545 [Oscillospiraceae bacterium]|nr:hypothetical protein [Oscillospiraceae bacterium]
MQSDGIISFKRNRYFFGKLLTAADFETEQRYFIEKQQLLNRLMYGVGVVCGMGVLKADDETIVVESGFAFDSAGREVIIPHSQICKLSRLDGFNQIAAVKSQASNIVDVYLCVQYDETPCDAVHSIARSALDDENGGPEYNKTIEKCSLYLTAGEPLTHPHEPYNSRYSDMLIFNENGVRVSICAPRYVAAGKTFNIETHIDKGAVTSPVDVSFRLKLSFLTADGKREIRIGYSESKLSSSQRNLNAGCTLRATLTASNTVIDFAEISVFDFKIKIGDLNRGISESFLSQVRIVQNENDVTSLIHETQASKNLEDVLKNNPEIYLARLNLIMSPEYCIISKIEPLPFRQRVTVPAYSLTEARPKFPVISAVSKRGNPKEATEQKITEPTDESSTRSLMLYPDVYYAKPHETVTFEINSTNGQKPSTPESFIWSVFPESGGRISRSGIFTASDEKGSYTITAQTPDNLEKAESFIVIG